MLRTVSNKALLKASLALLVPIVLAGGYWFFAHPSVELPRSALEFAPQRSLLVGHVDVARVLSSEAYREWTREHEDAGLARITAQCGFNPLSRVESAFVFLGDANEPTRDELGVLLRGPIRSQAMLKCLKDAIEAGGGGIREAHVRDFSAIISEHGTSEAVFVGSDGVLGGAPAIVESVLDVLERKTPSLSADAWFRRIWSEVSNNADIAMAARMPASWRGALGRLAERSGLPSLANLEGAGASLRLGTDNRLTVVVATANDADASSLSNTAQTMLRAQAEDLVLRLTVVGRLFSRLHVGTQGPLIVATVNGTVDEVKRAAELYGRVNRGEMLDEAREANAPAAPAAPANEPAAPDAAP
jgi:hypothetical protein